MFKHYAHIQDGVVLEYPVDPRIWDHSTNSFNIDEYWEGGELDGKTYVFCHNFEPAFNYDETLVEKTPAFDESRGIWCRRYDVIKVDAITLEERKASYQRGVDSILERLESELSDMAQIIMELSDAEKTKWQDYRTALRQVCLHPEYPFQYVIPDRPDKAQDLNIEVKRI